MNAEITTLQKANEALSKHKKAKRIYVYKGEALSIREAIDILTQREVDKQMQTEKRCRGSRGRVDSIITYCCRKYRKIGYNVQTYQIDIEVLEVYNDQQT